MSIFTSQHRCGGALLYLSLSVGCCLHAQNLIDAADVAKKLSTSVVLIKGTSETGQIVGSGFLLSSDGVIATNLHVIREIRSGSVQLTNGEIFDNFTVLAFDERKDLAIIKVAAFDVPAAVLGNSNDVKVGEPVVALGSPKGLTGTVTAGIVSAIRDHPAIAGYKVLQTDAAINPGNSGGPLVNANGEIVGVVVSKVRESEGLNFAVPINYVRGMMSSLRPPMSLSAMRQELGTSPDVFAAPKSTFPTRWKSLQAPTVRSLRVNGDRLYAELLTPMEGVRFQTYDLKKNGQGYTGTSRIGVTCEYRDLWSGQYATNQCILERNVELTSVSDTRIEGRSARPAKGVDFNCRKCTYSKPQDQWESFAWIPE